MQGMSAGKVKGFDISHFNGRVDFAKAKRAGYEFVYVKASEGTGYIDPMFLANVKAAKATGLHVGAYHFARPGDGTADAVAEADHFVEVIKQVELDLLPVLDLEVSMLDAQQTTQWALAFVDRVEKATGHKMMLYTGVSFAQEHGGFANKLAHLPLWVAYYSNSAPPDCGGWNAWTVWQHSETGSVPGVNGNCDVNVAVSLDAILAKTGGQSVNYKDVNQIPLSLGAKGDLVKLLQQWLEIPADGFFGTATEESVRDWQAAHDKDGKPGHGLKVTGVVDAETWRALNIAKTGKDPYTAKPTVAPQPQSKPEAKPAPAPAPKPQSVQAPQPAHRVYVYHSGKVDVFNDIDAALSFVKNELSDGATILVERVDVK